MKNKMVIATMVMLFAMGANAVGAEEVVVPITDMPLGDGIVIDVSDLEGEPEDVTGVDDIPTDDGDAVTPPVGDDLNDDAVANDGTDLPLDQGDLDAADIDTGSEEVIEAPAPEDDNVVLTDNDQPKVETLAQTGIEENKLFAGLVALAGIVGFIFTRKRKAIKG